ncbi:MAG: hypothetical protein RIE08_14755 [Acidimicrobiales bacterium]
MTEPRDTCLGDDTLVDLALGNLNGRERADSLAHAADCANCRHELHALVEVTETLLQAGPPVDPPPGFETSVLAHTAPSKPHRRRALVAAAAAVVALLGAFALLALLDSGDDTIAEATMVTPSGHDVGSVWHNLEEDQPWILLSIPRWTLWEESGPHRYRLEAVLADDATVDLGPVEFAADDGTFAMTVGADLGRIRSLAVIDESGREWCRGQF